MEENRNKPPAYARYRREAGQAPGAPASEGERLPADTVRPERSTVPPHAPEGLDGPARGVGGIRPRHAGEPATARTPVPDDSDYRETSTAAAPRRPGVPAPETPSPAMRQNIFTRGAQRRAEAAAQGRSWGPSDVPQAALDPDRAGMASYGRAPRPGAAGDYGQSGLAEPPLEGPGGPGLRGLEQGVTSVRHIVAEDRSRPVVNRKALILTVLGCLVFGLFGAVVYLAYRQTLGFSGEVPLVQAPDKPYKEPPEAGGGADVASEGSNVMGVFAGRGDDARVERIMPRDQPAPMSLDQADPGLRDRADGQGKIAMLEAPAVGPMPSGLAQPSATQPQAAPSASNSQPTTTAATGNASATPAATAPAQPPPAPPTPRVVAAPQTTSQQANTGNAPRSLFPQGGSTTAPAAGPARSAPAASPTRTAALPPSQAAGGSWRVQLAAVGSRQAAEEAWRVIRQRNPSVASMSVSYVEAQIGSAHVVRVQAGSFADRDDAAHTCQVLRNAGSDCFVVGNSR